MIDTSSSMTRDRDNNDTSVETNTRLYMLKQSYAEMLADFRTPGEDGRTPDIRLAVADFNGFTTLDGSKASSTTNTYQNNDYIGIVCYDQQPKVHIYTNMTGTNRSIGKYGTSGTIDGTIDATAFVDINDTLLDEIPGKIATTRGTNYDYAFDTIYRLGTAIKQENFENGVNRELYVIFMTDGAAFQFNYMYSRNTQSGWQNWLAGSGYSLRTGAHRQFFGGEGLLDTEETLRGQKHWMAEAIKGTPSKQYTVIAEDDMGGVGTKIDGEDYMFKVPGLGATMYSIGFCLTADGSVGVDYIKSAVKETASVQNGERLYYNADDETALTKAFIDIASSIRHAATNAYFADTIGEAYDLKMTPSTYTVNGATKTITPKIEALEYPVYTKDQNGKTIDGHTVTDEDVGNRYGTPTTIETVTFNSTGTAAYSNGGTENILIDGVICADSFWYNTTDEEIDTIDLNDDGALNDSDILAPETFYWKLGTIDETESVLRYYVYLTGSMGEDGGCEEGSYPTNESAVLYYQNWLGNNAHKDTTSPVLPWGGANVSYAFYLVNDNGEPVNKSGTVVPFAQRVAVTSPVIYKTINLNTASTIDTISLAANDVFPIEYSLYDEDASYEIHVSSDGTDSYWEIGRSSDDSLASTTYVADYGGNPTRTLNGTDQSYDYTHTTVWFAVKLDKPVPDVVVVDYGLPVDIHVLDNDMFGAYGTLAAISATDPQVNIDDTHHQVDIADGFTNSLTFEGYGTAAVNTKTGVITYTPTSMKMDKVIKFWYAIHYVDKNVDEGEQTWDKYYYTYVEVVPATSIYYEDTVAGDDRFITFSGDWTDAGSVAGRTAQSEDRPGFYSILNDANSIYGFDNAYNNCEQYSLGSAKHVTVEDGDTPMAQFTFTGTGFDVISMTSNGTGFVKIKVFEGTNTTGKAKYTWGVDTYYGYKPVEEANGTVVSTWTYTSTGVWSVKAEINEDLDYADAPADGEFPKSPTAGDTVTLYTPNYEWEVVAAENGDALYQIPVLKSYEKLSYGTYTVQILPIYTAFYDHTGSEHYDFYLDAIRIYNPADPTDTTDYGHDRDGYEYIEDIYKRDNEAFPQYIEIRESLITNKDFNESSETNGAMFIDAFTKIDDGSENADYNFAQYGPNNEVYLAKDQSIAFKIGLDISNPNAKVAAVHIGAKAVDGAAGFTVIGSGNKTVSLSTSTDMFYDISGIVNWDGDNSNTLIITNTGDNIVSLTQLKITYTADPTEAPMMLKSEARMFSTASTADYAVNTLRSMYAASNTAEPETAVTEETEPKPIEHEIAIRATEVAPEANGTFTPKKLGVTLSKTEAKVGQTVRMTITVSKEVSAVWVNGEKAILAKTDNKTGEKIFGYAVNCIASGTMKLSTVAYNTDGAISKAVETTLKVTSKR